MNKDEWYKKLEDYIEDYEVIYKRFYDDQEARELNLSNGAGIYLHIILKNGEDSYIFIF